MVPDERTWFEVIAELLAKDIDMELVRKQLALTPTERLLKLEAMNEFYRTVRKQRAAIPEDARRAADR